MPGPTQTSGNENDSPTHHIEVMDDSHKDKPSPQPDGEPSPGLRNSKGWDGKLRVPKNAVLSNPEALSDPEYSDDDNVAPGGEISADEGNYLHFAHTRAFL